MAGGQAVQIGGHRGHGDLIEGDKGGDMGMGQCIEETGTIQEDMRQLI